MNRRLLVAVLGVSIAGCGSSTVVEAGAPAGTADGPCYDNGTCNAGLSCVASICAAGDATTNDAPTADTTPLGDSAPADDGTDAVAVDSTTVSDTGTRDSASPADTGSALGDSVAALDTSNVTTDAAGSDSTAAIDALGSDVADSAVAIDSAIGDADAARPPYVETTITGSCDPLTAAFDVSGARGDDVASSKAGLPFAFDFFGTAVTDWSMTSNGFAQLWSSSGGGGVSTASVNVAIPTAAQPNGLLAPFWDDLAVDPSNSSTARSAVIGNSPNRRFVIDWTHWTTKGETSNRVSFQVKLYETTNVIEFHYCGMQPADNARATGSSATVGLESLTGGVGVQHSFNTASAVASNQALRFTP